MARIRTQKGVAGRIDLNYHKQWHPWWKLRLGLVMLCTVLALGWFAFSSVRFDNGKLRLVDAIHNPGPVTRAHAQIEKNCNACHDGDNNNDGTPDNGYWLTVSDAACIKCHDGALHHENQLVADDRAKVSLASLNLAIKDDKHAGGAMSAGCIQCHTEHRGPELLLGLDDKLCISCHTDVSAASHDKGKIGFKGAVTGFAFDRAAANNPHPSFGRKLAPPPSTQPTTGGVAPTADQWVDGTEIKFNHKKHYESGNPMIGDMFKGADSCVMCHSVVEPPTKMLNLATKAKEELARPPYASALGTERPTATSSSSDLRYIQPISYDRHCVGCHTGDVKLPNAAQNMKVKVKQGEKTADMQVKDFIKQAEVPHEDMSVLRGFAEAAVRTTLKNESLQGPKPTDKVARADWLPVAVTDVAKKVNAKLADASLKDQMGNLAGRKLSFPEKLDDPAWKTVDETVLVDYYAALAVVAQCTRCHSVTGELPTLDPKKNAELRAGSYSLIRTAPTKIYDQPRRWFPASNFDHNSHRLLDCMSCHAPAKTSSDTGEVLTSDIDGVYSGISAERRAAVGKATVSCVDCHHASTSASVGAPANCVTCHNYHDHQFARSMDNPHHGAAMKAMGFKVAEQPATPSAAPPTDAAAAPTPEPATTKPE